MPDKLRHRHKVLYGVGESGFGILGTILGTYFAIFMTDVVGIRPGIVAAVLFIGRCWDFVNDPLLGYLSDRTRTRWGRRRPFLIFGALPLAASFAMLWWRPPWEGALALAGYYLLAYLLFETALTLTYMPYVALTPDLTPNYDERTSLTTYRMIFNLCGSLVAFTVPLLIIQSFVPDNAPRVFAMGAGFGLLAALGVVVVFFGVRERARSETAPQVGFFQALRTTWRNRVFRISLAMFMATWVAIDVLLTALLFFIKYVMQREGQSELMLASIFVVAIIALPGWSWLARTLGKRGAYLIGVSAWAAVQLALLSVGPNSSLALILSLCALIGVGVAAAHVLPWAMLPDAIEWGEWQTGERHEGVLYSLVTSVQKMASAVAIALTLLVLDVTGYVPNAAAQPPEALLGLRLVIGPVPALVLGLGVVAALRYPLTRDGHSQLVADLRARAAAADRP